MSDPDLLAEQAQFYVAEAADYDAWFEAMFDPENDQPAAATFRRGHAAAGSLLARLAPLGRTLELAGGTGLLTDLLLPHVDSLVVLDSSSPSLELARRRVAHHRREVEWVEADLFGWSAGVRRFDTIAFSAWLHHVPTKRFDGFWRSVAEWLAPAGRVVFDFPTSSNGTPMEELAPVPDEVYRGYRPVDGVAVRDHHGRRWRVVHVLWDEAELFARLARLGWDVTSGGPGWADGMRWAIATRRHP